MCRAPRASPRAVHRVCLRCVNPEPWILRRPLYSMEQAATWPMLKAREDSECVERVCCPRYRSFNMVATGRTGGLGWDGLV